MTETPSGTKSGARLAWFLVGFLVVALIVAGLISYFASSSPDGLDTVALNGCEVTAVDGQEQLNGTCIAQNAADSATKDSPFAGYAVGGAAGSVGLAGIVGVLVVALIGGGLFWLIRRRSGPDGS